MPYGIVLAGGQARRMGGGDKGLLPYRGGTVLDAVVRRLRPHCAALILSANGDPARFAALGLPVVPDHPADAGKGPLAGILAGLDAVAALAPTCRAIVTAPTDTPLLPPDLVPRLLEQQRASGQAVCVARSAGRNHPTVALWSLDTRQTLRALLREAGTRRLMAAQEALGCCTVEWLPADVDPFHNVNTPDDLAALPC